MTFKRQQHMTGHEGREMWNDKCSQLILNFADTGASLKEFLIDGIHLWMDQFQYNNVSQYLGRAGQQGGVKNWT